MAQVFMNAVCLKKDIFGRVKKNKTSVEAGTFLIPLLRKDCGQLVIS